jgi:hypothetical protein
MHDQSGRRWGFHATSEVNHEEGHDGVRNVVGLPPFAFGRTQDRGNGKNLCRPHPETRAKLRPGLQPGSRGQSLRKSNCCGKTAQLLLESLQLPQNQSAAKAAGIGFLETVVPTWFLESSRWIRYAVPTPQPSCFAFPFSEAPPTAKIQSSLQIFRGLLSHPPRDRFPSKTRRTRPTPLRARKASGISGFA